MATKTQIIEKTGCYFDSGMAFANMLKVEGQSFIQLSFKKDKYGFYSRYDVSEVQQHSGFVEKIYVNKNDWFQFYRKFLKINITARTVTFYEGNYKPSNRWPTHYLSDFSIYVLPSGKLIDVRKLFYFGIQDDKINLKRRLSSSDGPDVQERLSSVGKKYTNIGSEFCPRLNCIRFYDHRKEDFLRIKL